MNEEMKEEVFGTIDDIYKIAFACMEFAHDEKVKDPSLNLPDAEYILLANTILKESINAALDNTKLQNDIIDLVVESEGEAE